MKRLGIKKKKKKRRKEKKKRGVNEPGKKRTSK
jgi:hypothetical protein